MCRKRWYQKAIEASMLWKAMEMPMKNISLWKTISKTNSWRKLRKCRSTTTSRVASSFTHVCLCAPISSYTDIFQANVVVPPRRSFSYPRSRSTTRHELRGGSGGRKIFRGKSLTDDVLMRRFVIDEEAMMQVRKRNEMEIIRRRSGMRNTKIGPSPLSRMVLAMED